MRGGSGEEDGAAAFAVAPKGGGEGCEAILLPAPSGEEEMEGAEGFWLREEERA